MATPRTIQDDAALGAVFEQPNTAAVGRGWVDAST